MIENVAALYVDARGPYPKLVRHWYDEKRDARTYAGPWPIVAHPPCGPWGAMAHLSRETTKDLAPIAVEQVRRFGGILEHPVGSRLWRFCEMAGPGELPDRFGGVTIRLEQVSWGHACRKPTLLYMVGIRSIPGFRTGGEPTHQIFGSRNATIARKHGHRTDLKAAGAELRRRTPIEFARWLLDIASRCAR